MLDRKFPDFFNSTLDSWEWVESKSWLRAGSPQEDAIAKNGVASMGQGYYYSHYSGDLSDVFAGLLI